MKIDAFFVDYFDVVINEHQLCFNVNYRFEYINRSRYKIIDIHRADKIQNLTLSICYDLRRHLSGITNEK